MTVRDNQLTPDHNTPSNEQTDAQEITAAYRRDLAFPKLTSEMVQRLREYGREEIVAANLTLYTFGDRETDMFVILDGEIDVLLPSSDGTLKIFARHRRLISAES